MSGVAIIGCGRIGTRRAADLGGLKLLAVADIALDRAQALASGHTGCRAFADWREALEVPGLSVAIVATTHDLLAPVTRAALERGLHVFVEKPAARRPEELDGLAELARAGNLVVQVGYNHRRHPALREAHRLAMAGAIGRLTHIRASYGHGGRMGYEQEWRADPERGGGGELLDQGSHLIDLARWFLGEISAVDATLTTAFWDMDVEDNAFVRLATAGGQVAWLHASWTEWKNRFSFEIFGRTGKLEITGLGGSYGPERLTLFTMRPELGPPDIESWDYPGPDLSMAEEFAQFTTAIAEGRPTGPGLVDARAVLEVVAAAYARAVRP